jgi:DNA-binding beta-propeller fold protein YncE
MEREAQQRRAEALDHFWDALLADDEAERPDDVNEVFAATIDRLRELGDAPGLAAARGRIWRNLTEHAAPPRPEPIVPFRARVLASTQPTGGAAADADRRPWNAAPGRLRWVLAQAATILLLIGTVALLYFAFSRVRPEQPVVIIPAIEIPIATPAATPQLVTTAPVKYLWLFTDPEEAKLAVSPSITIALDGNLWIVDGAREGFQIISPTGELLERWGKPGKGDGEFNFHRDALNAVGDVAFRPDGGFYVADSHNFRIQQFDQNRQFVRAWGSFGSGPGQFREPESVLVDAEGNVYVIDGKRDDVQKFDAEGNFLLQFGGHGSADGQLNNAAWGVLDADSNLWITDDGNDRLQQFAPDGTFLRTIGSKGAGQGEFDEPQGIAIDATGRLYVTDSANARVQVFDRDGKFLFAFAGDDVGGTAFVWPVAIAVDKAGEVYVQEYATEQGYELIQTFRSLPAQPP